MKRRVGILLALCVLATTLVGCGQTAKKVGASKNEEKAKLVIAARGGSHVDVIEAVKGKFEEENNVEIEVLGLEASDLKQKVSLDVKNSKGTYDLMMIDDPWMPEFCEANMLANITEMGYKEDNDFVKASLDIGRNPYGSGDIYALPFAGNVQLLFYNKGLLEEKGIEVPETWEEVLKVSQSINGQDGKLGYVIRGQQGNPIVSDYLPLLWAYGGDVFDDKWNVTVNSEAGKKSLEMYMELLKNGVNYEKNDIVSSVSSGNAAMSLGWPSWYISGENSTAGYAIVPGKVNNSSKEYRTGMIGNWMMAVTNNSQNKELSLKLLEYLTSEDVQKAAMEYGGVPTRTSVFSDSELNTKYPYLQALLVGTKNSVIRPRTAKWADIENVYGTELSNAISGIKTIDKALEDAKTEIEKIMQ